MATTPITYGTLAGTAADFKVPDVIYPGGIAKRGGTTPGTIDINSARPAPTDINGKNLLADNGVTALRGVEVQANRLSSNHLLKNPDQRVRLRVPPKYLVAGTTGGPEKNPVLVDLGGIIFPYTPSISYEVKADWSELKPLHSNFNVPFYQRSSVSPITVTGKFTVQNHNDANIYLSTVHLLRSLTKMRFGGAKSGDTDSGAPPPICRLQAYGDEMLKNIPVAVTNFRIELPADVDYYSLDESISVPTISSLAITLLPVYSRQEMQNFSVTKYINRTYNEGYI